MAARSTEVLRLYRDLLREAAQFQNYTFRTYSQRRIKADFRANAGVQGGDLSAALGFGFEQLNLLRRQVTISKLYPGEKSVMENLH
ncbi:hypothetical protein H257_16211 [Aphanomyces astaci]|uniref:Complex 1 LYR protein domain-containing protein n=1 Tax=Aphanomyces astaci TaxID=112090 RepID=W4FLD3_APHAT|nr:hypothetical protein H257_16211 [Aphanomyces astaci]ETV67614.1 hypothetical protein H257_16211 [Aphanomyces astaci]KAF0774938.1 hypothetical protein AaE_001361 [Aphanomyces astaci]RHY07740.1 hypothetical protein DYB36_005514 [Aphanomyces astaci]RHY08259.1 hypothetical protein DYB25_006420 [Aphanomyces astaci]RHY66732.1 hypothetical protein DYB30_005420 [Aphanomyces astaci]|eukprot:XP_009842871.1 hypothetical protein H257_16211 [Aphanomyces astaci]